MKPRIHNGPIILRFSQLTRTLVIRGALEEFGVPYTKSLEDFDIHVITVPSYPHGDLTAKRNRIKAFGRMDLHHLLMADGEDLPDLTITVPWQDLNESWRYLDGPASSLDHSQIQEARTEAMLRNM